MVYGKPSLPQRFAYRAGQFVGLAIAVIACVAVTVVLIAALGAMSHVLGVR